MTDPILSRSKFTTAFREIDREGQACIRITNSGPSLVSFEGQFLRTLVVKRFNLDSTCQLLTVGLGEEPRLRNFDLNRYFAILPDEGIYSGAYYIQRLRQVEGRRP